MHFNEGNTLALISLVAFPDDGGLVSASCQVSVEAVRACVQQSVLEPLDTNVSFERVIADLGEGPNPVNALAMLSPECVGIADRLVVHCRIQMLSQICVLAE